MAFHHIYTNVFRNACFMLIIHYLSKALIILLTHTTSHTFAVLPFLMVLSNIQAHAEIRYAH